jgi:phosphotransferase system enzyme I (PtsI)
MIVFDANSQALLSRKNNSETILNARAVSRGIAIGRVVCLHGYKRQFYQINLKDSEIENELLRFSVAIRLAKSQLKKIIAQKSEIASENKTNIFEAHLLILEDKSLLSKIENTIKDEKINSEWAVKLITDNYLTAYKTITDGHLRERYIDVEDVSDRLQSALVVGEQKSVAHLKKIR